MEEKKLEKNLELKVAIKAELKNRKPFDTIGTRINRFETPPLRQPTTQGLKERGNAGTIRRKSTSV